MNDNDLKILANTYGANLDRWPEVSRGEAAEIFAANSDFFAEARELDAALDGFKTTKASHDLFERIISQIETRTAANPLLLFFFRSALARSAALLFCALSGLLLGSINMPDSQDFADSLQDEGQDIFNTTSSTITNEVLP